MEIGHRLGFACWIGVRQQDRRYRMGRLYELLDRRELAGPPSMGRIRREDLEDVDVIWYVRGPLDDRLGGGVDGDAGRAGPAAARTRWPRTSAWSASWSSCPSEPNSCGTSWSAAPLLRSALEDGGWHLVKANHLRDWAERESVSLADLEALLGLDPTVERTGDQLPLVRWLTVNAGTL